MSKIQKMLDAGIPVIPEESDEKTGSYSFRDLSETQRIALHDIINPPTAAELRTRARKANAKSEAKLANEIKNLSADQAVSYIETNVTNLASAKAVLKIMARMLVALRDHAWPELPEE